MEKIKKNKKIIILTLFIIILIIIDQSVKAITPSEPHFINDSIKIVGMQNYGGAFGVGQSGTMTFIVTNVIVIGIIVKFMHMQENQIDKKTYFALSLIIGGALSNLIDKIFKGYVLEIISIKSLIFNIADIVIILGWVLLALFFAMHTSKIKLKKGEKVE